MLRAIGHSADALALEKAVVARYPEDALAADTLAENLQKEAKWEELVQIFLPRLNQVGGPALRKKIAIALWNLGREYESLRLDPQALHMAGLAVTDPLAFAPAFRALLQRDRESPGIFKAMAEDNIVPSNASTQPSSFIARIVQTNGAIDDLINAIETMPASANASLPAMIDVLCDPASDHTVHQHVLECLETAAASGGLNPREEQIFEQLNRRCASAVSAALTAEAWKLAQRRGSVGALLAVQNLLTTEQSPDAANIVPWVDAFLLSQH